MNLLEKLSQYLPSNELEIAFRDEILTFLKTAQAPYCRSNRSGHITGSALLIHPDGTKFLLMHHRKLDKWLQPGGHCDGDENVLNVAIKEAQEESGIQSITPITEDIFDVDVHLIPANSRDEAHYHYDVRFLLKAGVDRLIQNHESKELRWVELSNYQELDLMPSIQRLANKACSFLKEA